METWISLNKSALVETAERLSELFFQYVIGGVSEVSWLGSLTSPLGRHGSILLVCHQLLYRWQTVQQEEVVTSETVLLITVVYILSMKSLVCILKVVTLS